MEKNTGSQKNFISTLDIRSKLSGFFVFLTWSFLFNHPAWHFIMGVLIISTAISMGLSLKSIFSRLLPLLPLFLMIIVFTGFAGTQDFLHQENKTILFTIPIGFKMAGSGIILEMSKGGLMLGLSFLLRLINMVVMTILILESTDLDDFINLFIRLKLPHSLSFIITTAIRFVPELDKKRNLIINAQRARGIDPDQGGWLRHFKVRISIMIPLIINSIIMADQLSMALLNRGFGYKNHWTILSELRLEKKDYLALIICFFILTSGITLRYKGSMGLI